MRDRGGILATPERVASILSVAMIAAFALVVVTLTGPLAAGSPTPGPSGRPTRQPTPAPSAATPATTPVPTPAPAELRQLATAVDRVLTEAEVLRATLAAGGTGAELASDIRRLNQAVGLALDAARAAEGPDAAGQVASDLVTALEAMRQRISDGLAVTQSNTAAYRATAADILAQVPGITTLQTSLRVLIGA